MCVCTVLEHTLSLDSLTWTVKTGLFIHRSIPHDFIECWLHAWSWGDSGEEHTVSTLCSLQPGLLPALWACPSPLHIALGLPFSSARWSPVLSDPVPPCTCCLICKTDTTGDSQTFWTS